MSEFLAKNNNKVLDLMAENEALKAHNHRLRKRWEELTSLVSEWQELTSLASEL